MGMQSISAGIKCETCFYKVQVNCTDHLGQLLDQYRLQEAGEAQEVQEFDIWMHANLQSQFDERGSSAFTGER